MFQNSRRLGLFKIRRSNVQSFHATAFQRQALPAVQLTPKKKGWLAWIMGDIEPSTEPLYVPMPDVVIPTPLPDSIKPAETKITKLANGLRIASEDLPGATATIGLYVESGCIYESSENAGASHLLERMAFRTTKNRSHFRLVREVEAIGANITASASREQMAYSGDVIKTFMPHMVEILVDAVRNPAFHSWEVKDELHKVKNEIAEVAKNPQSILFDALHSAGFLGAFAQPLLASESAFSRLNPEVLHNFVNENYTASRMVLAASGVNHEELLEVAEPLLADLPPSAASCPDAKYIGGDWRAQDDSPVTHVAIAFEVPGGWKNEKDSIALVVLQTLLGGGQSFSTGGPGKGMYSRLYRRVLDKFSGVESCTAFHSIYSNSGITGIHATSGSDFIEQLIDIVTKELLAIAKPGEVSNEELERAKNAAISGVLMNLENRMVVTEDIGRQILTYGERKPIRRFIETVRSLTANDITKVAGKVISTPLTMASWGDVGHVPRYDTIASRFR